jgi:urease accessory protein
MPSIRWRVLQLIDSGFPTGGFAHSCGLEAAVHLGLLRTDDDLDVFVRGYLWNVGAATLPFVRAAHEDPRDATAVDELLDAHLMNHVANRASRTQGRALLVACARVFGDPTVVRLSERANRARDIPAHLAPMFGAALGALGVSRDDTLGAFVYVSLRTVLSAAVRLGLAGPYEAQRLQHRHEPTLDSVLARCGRLQLDDVATTAPLLDVFGATHDRLYSRLHQS